MKMYKTIILWTILFMSTLIYSQTVSVLPVAAACPGQGSVTVTTTGVTNPFFQLKNSVGTNIGSGSTTGSFIALDAGNYSVLVTGESGFSQTENFTIGNTYVTIPAATITISGICDNTFSMGGSLAISIPPVSGKTYTYKVVKSNDPNFSDTTGTYVAITNSTAITSFGNYQIRVKDECGQTVTYTRTVQPSLPPVASVNLSVVNSQLCGSGLIEMVGLQFSTDGGAVVNLNNYAALGGVKMEMWENTSTGCPTSVPNTAPVFSKNITTPHGHIVALVPSKRYVVRFTTPCGEIRIGCVSVVTGTIPEMNVTSSVSGCGSLERMTIKGLSSRFLQFPVFIDVKNQAGSVYTYTATSAYYLDEFWAATNLMLDDYEVTYTDNCGTILSKDVFNPNPNPSNPVAPVISNINYTKYRCYNDNTGSLIVTGTTQIALTITGYIPNRANAIVTIISGPSNVGVPATIHNNSLFAWTNVVPGNYVIRINPNVGSCSGQPLYDLPFVVNPPSVQILHQSILSQGTSFCTGGGSISSTIVYSGIFNNVVELLDQNGNWINENSSGNFNNLPSGTYNTRLRVSTCTSTKYYVNNSGSPIVITDASSGPQVVKKVGIVCEDAAGVPVSTGSAYIEIAGASPVLVEYKLQSSSVWTVFSNNAPAAFQIDNLDPNTVYDVRVTSCGKSVGTSVAIQTPGAFSATTMVQPCIGQPYTLSAPDYAGATYQWSNSSGILANTREFNIPNFNATYDGLYTATITWGGCVVRYFNLIIDSTKCGGPIDDICMEKPIVQDLSNLCPTTTVNLNLAHSATIPNGIDLLWFEDSLRSGAVLTGVDITQAGAGTYYAFYYDSLNDCYSLASNPVVVTINACKKALIITNPMLRNKGR